MIEWQDEGILLSVKPHGEGHALVQVLTAEHGRYAGLVHGGASAKRAPELQPGAEMSVEWRARLADHLGTFSYDLFANNAARWISDRHRLGAIAAAAAIATVLPEREPIPSVFAGLKALLQVLELDAWPAAYVSWELGVLSAMGYGLALDHCAVTGASTGLAFVSPRTGAAVTADGAGEFAGRLLPLPPFLAGADDFSDQDVADGLRLSGHFLKRDAFGAVNQDLPPARYRLADMFQPPATP